MPASCRTSLSCGLEGHLCYLWAQGLCVCAPQHSLLLLKPSPRTQIGEGQGVGRVTDTQHLCPGPREWKSVSQKFSMWPLLRDSEAAWSLAPGCGLPGSTEHAQLLVRKLPGCLDLQPPGIPPPQSSLPSSLHASCPPFHRPFFLLHRFPSFSLSLPQSSWALGVSSPSEGISQRPSTPG